MDVFEFRNYLVDEYRQFSTGYSTIQADDIRQFVKREYGNQRYWPARGKLTYAAVEIEAESVAFIVAERFNLRSTSEAYLSSFVQSHEKIPEEVSVGYITKVASLLERMGNDLLPTPAPKKKKI